MPPTTATSSRPSPPRAGRRQLLLDAFVALVLTGLLVLNGAVLFDLDLPDVPSPTTLTWVSGVVMCVALALRRLVPLTVLVVVASAFTVYGFTGGLDTFGSNIALFLAVVTAGSHGRGRARDVVRGLVIAGLFATIAYAFVDADALDGAGARLTFVAQFYTVALNVFYFLAAWILGDQIRARAEREAELRARTSELATRTAELERERERTAEQATVAERLRLARELHDVLGHHVSVMGVQAAAARRVLDRDPARAVEPITAIETSSRSAISELQRVLALLRADEDPTAATFTVHDRLDDLARELRHAGLEVTCQVTDLPELPTEIDLAVGRVVQEALTNVLRHAGPGTSAWVRLSGRDDRVEVEVVDDGRGTPLADRHGGGTGLSGMRDRVRLHGGRFEASPVRRGGFRVHATVPLPPATPPTNDDELRTGASTTAPTEEPVAP